MAGNKLLFFLLFVFLSTFSALVKAASEEEFEENLSSDPCLTKRCFHGSQCVVVNDEPTCQCVKECADNTDRRRRVCSNNNSTWQSDCHLYRHRCLCREEKVDDCLPEHKHLKIHYYGECQEIGNCDDDVLVDFPRRMREWLYTVMSTRILKKPKEDDGHVEKWIDAVIWKFCDLDRHPHDRKVSTDELFPLRAPFLAMETCIGTFLDSKCDPNNDGQISLLEWGQCLQVPEGEMEDKCNDFVKLAASSAQLE